MSRRYAIAGFLCFAAAALHTCPLIAGEAKEKSFDESDLILDDISSNQELAHPEEAAQQQRDGVFEEGLETPDPHHNLDALFGGQATPEEASRIGTDSGQPSSNDLLPQTAEGTRTAADTSRSETAELDSPAPAASEPPIEPRPIQVSLLPASVRKLFAMNHGQSSEDAAFEVRTIPLELEFADYHAGEFLVRWRWSDLDADRRLNVIDENAAGWIDTATGFDGGFGASEPHAVDSSVVAATPIGWSAGALNVATVSRLPGELEPGLQPPDVELPAGEEPFQFVRYFSGPVVLVVGSALEISVMILFWLLGVKRGDKDKDQKGKPNKSVAKNLEQMTRGDNRRRPIAGRT